MKVEGGIKEQNSHVGRLAVGPARAGSAVGGWLFFCFLLFALSFELSAQIPGQEEPGRTPLPGELPVDTAGVDTAAEDREPSTLEDTLRIYSPLTVTRIREADMNTDSLVTYMIDTTITGYQNYSPFYTNGRYLINNGNYGLAARSLFADFDKEIGFRSGQQAFELYRYDKSQVEYYRTRSPYTDLHFIGGGEPEQVFDFIHTQNLKPRLNAGIEYKAVGSKGYYARQRVKHLNIAGFSWYESPNLRYNLLGNIIVTDLQAPENGGLVNDNIFDEVSSNQDQILEENVFLENTNSRWKGTALYLKQYYSIGRIDTAGTGKSYAEKVYPHQRISHSIYLDNKTYTYRDQSGDPSYYYTVFNPDPEPHDTIRYRNLENEFTLSVFGRTGLQQQVFSKAAILEAGLKHRLISYQQGIIDTNFHVLSLKGKAGYQFSEKLNILFNGERVFLGPYDGDISLGADANLFISDAIGTIKLGGLYQRKRPEFMFERYYSSYHRWENDFDKENLSQLRFSWYNNRLELGLSGEYTLLGNYTFFRGAGNYVTPYQYTGDMDILKLELNKKIRFSRFTLSAQLVYQRTNFRNILLTPEFYGYGSLYYENKLFKVLDFQLGTDVRYFTETKAYGYRPELGRYYVADNDWTIGDYPVADVFVTARLRRARFFAKLEHVNQGLLKRGYYTVQRYGMPPRSFKFGLSWRFYD